MLTMFRAMQAHGLAAGAALWGLLALSATAQTVDVIEYYNASQDLYFEHCADRALPAVSAHARTMPWHSAPQAQRRKRRTARSRGGHRDRAASAENCRPGFACPARNRPNQAGLSLLTYKRGAVIACPLPDLT